MLPYSCRAVAPLNADKLSVASTARFLDRLGHVSPPALRAVSVEPGHSNRRVTSRLRAAFFLFPEKRRPGSSRGTVDPIPPMSRRCPHWRSEPRCNVKWQTRAGSSGTVPRRARGGPRRARSGASSNLNMSVALRLSQRGTTHRDQKSPLVTEVSCASSSSLTKHLPLRICFSVLAAVRINFAGKKTFIFRTAS